MNICNPDDSIAGAVTEKTACISPEMVILERRIAKGDG
jgi:hypothetical protein